MLYQIPRISNHADFRMLTRGIKQYDIDELLECGKRIKSYNHTTIYFKSIRNAFMKDGKKMVGIAAVFGYFYGKLNLISSFYVPETQMYAYEQCYKNFSTYRSKNN